jgi:type II secretion system protein I
MTKRLSEISGRKGGFTLLEVLLALGVFALAAVGLIVAIDTALRAALSVRDRSMARRELESRLAYCLADPPGPSKRVLTPEQNHGVRVEETLVPWPMKNGDGKEVAGMKKLTILTGTGDSAEKAEILLYRP